MSRCTHWMHADCLRRSPAEALGEVSPQARRTQFRIGRRIAGPPRGHGFCSRRSPQVPCLIRKVGLAAEAAAKAVEQAVAAVEAEAVEQVAVEQVAAAKAVVVLVERAAAEAQAEAAKAVVVLVERVVAGVVGPAV